MDNNNINLSPERRAKWEASGEGAAFNALVRKRKGTIKGNIMNLSAKHANIITAQIDKREEAARRLREANAAEFASPGVQAAMASAAKDGSNRLAAEAERVRKERNEQAKQLEQRREARMAKFAAMKPRGGSRKRKTRKTRKTRKHRR